MAKFRFNRITIKHFLAITIPLAMQSLITTFVNLVDNVMVGSLGEEAIAAVNQANQYFFVYSLILFGIGSGSSVFMAQFWGKRDFRNIRRIAGLGTMVSLAAGVIFAAAGTLSPETIMGVLSTDARVINSGSGYLKILAPSFLLTAVTVSAAYILKSIENVKTPLFASILSVITNIFFNWVFIYGNLGAPALGVAGAAIATVIARVLEFAVMLYGVFNTAPFLRHGLFDYIKIPKKVIKRFINISMPVILNESIWSLGTSLYTVIYARIGSNPKEGTAALAAVHITSLAERLFSVFIFGMGHAVAIIIGKEIGSKRSRRARFAAYQFSWLAPLAGAFSSLILIAASPLFLALFNVTEGVAASARNLIFILAAALPIKNYNLVNIVGTLRGGGDTRFACILDIGGVWLLSLPLLSFCTFVLKLPIEAVFAASLLEEVVKSVLVFIRLKQKKWLHDLVNVPQ